MNPFLFAAAAVTAAAVGAGAPSAASPGASAAAPVPSTVTVGPAPASPPGVSPPAVAPRASARILGLAEAENFAELHQPSLTVARATTDVANARADQTLAPLLPQVNAQASYQRQTENFAARSSTLPSSVNSQTSKANFDTVGVYNFGLGASELIWDFGQTYGAHHAASVNAEATKQSEFTTLLGVLFNVRSAYLQAWAQKALVAVDQVTLTNDQRHLEQVDGFVKAGSRPEIDLAQSRADLANAELALVNAQGAYDSARAQLVQAMGLDALFDFEVADEALGPVDGEDLPADRLMPGALAARPEILALGKQLQAQELTVRADKGGYGPSLSVSANASENGADITSLTWNVSAGATLQWQLFQGGLTRAVVRGAVANESLIRAELVQERQQVQLDVVQALLGVRAAKVAITTAQEVETNTKEQLRLAEGRYQAGAGSIIELQDAQVADSNAAAQVIQAEYGLYVARASLKKALGRR